MLLWCSKGRVIKYIRAQSGAKIEIQRKDDCLLGATERGIDITGTENQIARAHQVCRLFVLTILFHNEKLS